MIYTKQIYIFYRQRCLLNFLIMKLQTLWIFKIKSLLQPGDNFYHRKGICNTLFLNKVETHIKWHFDTWCNYSWLSSLILHLRTVFFSLFTLFITLSIKGFWYDQFSHLKPFHIFFLFCLDPVSFVFFF